MDSAIEAGFLDEIVDESELLTRSKTLAGKLADLDQHAHRASKRRIRKATTRRIGLSLPLDLVDAVLTGLRRARQR